MEWLTCIRKTLDYVEAHIAESIDPDELSRQVLVSPYFLQKGFAVMTGFTLSEYIRSRRLYLAALELVHGSDKVIDIALRWGYETPESFSKAFFRFHGASPTAIRNKKAGLRTFLPLTIQITIHGGNVMNCKIAPMFPFKVIGFEKQFSASDNLNEAIPIFWDEICEKYAANVYAGGEPSNAYEKALMDNCIGEYGICLDDLGSGRVRYLIAGKYCGGEVPEGMALYEFPRSEWAVFDCYGPIPETLQKVISEIFSQWLPGNPEYELSGNAVVEWYDCLNGEKTDADYHSAVWVPVKRKEKA